MSQSPIVKSVFGISRSDLKAFFMAGTEGTGKYVVIANSDFGRVGVRYLSNDLVRVRVEPKNEVGASELAAVCGSGWKQPGEGGQPRFSRVVKQGDLAATVQPVLDRLAEAKLLQTNVLDSATQAKLVANPAAADWSFAIEMARHKAVAEQSTLVLKVAALGLPGASIADNWTVRTLRAKLAAFTPAEVRSRLTAKLAASGTKGINLASTWAMETLWKKAIGIAV